MTPEERYAYIDLKLTAVAESLELLAADIRQMQEERHAMQEEQRMLQEQQRDQDSRERILREALLSGVAAFLRELGRNPE